MQGNNKWCLYYKCVFVDNSVILSEVYAIFEKHFNFHNFSFLSLNCSATTFLTEGRATTINVKRPFRSSGPALNFWNQCFFPVFFRTSKKRFGSSTAQFLPISPKTQQWPSLSKRLTSLNIFLFAEMVSVLCWRLRFLNFG